MGRLIQAKSRLPREVRVFTDVCAGFCEWAALVLCSFADSCSSLVIGRVASFVPLMYFVFTINILRIFDDFVRF